MKIRILELGSNSFQLHGFEVSAVGVVRHLWGHKRMVRLAEGLNADAELDAEYAARGITAVGELLESSEGDAELVCFATSAVREARNRDVLLTPLMDQFALVPRILSGSEEARLSYAGALSTLDGLFGRVCVVDIGGGSTEVALGDHEGVSFACSARVGTLLGSDAVPALRQRLSGALARVRLARPERLVFASGSGRALQSLLVGQRLVDVDAPIPVAVLERIVPMLPAIPTWELERHGVKSDRAATLPAGGRLILEVARALGVPYVDVSAGGLREGAVLREWNRRRLHPKESGRFPVLSLGASRVGMGSPALGVSGS